MEGFGLQQDRHPVTGLDRGIGGDLVDLVGSGLIPGQQHVQQVAVDDQELAIGDRGGAEAARVTGGDGVLGLGAATAHPRNDRSARTQLDVAADQVVRPFVGFAFVEQWPAGRDLSTGGLLRQRPEVLFPQPVERRESPQ